MVTQQQPVPIVDPFQKPAQFPAQIWGVRYRLEDCRAGSDGTVVVDGEPIAGPILADNVAGRYYPRCARCGEQGPLYKVWAVPLRQWASSHRCPANPEDWQRCGTCAQEQA